MQEVIIRDLQKESELCGNENFLHIIVMLIICIFPSFRSPSFRFRSGISSQTFASCHRQMMQTSVCRPRNVGDARQRKNNGEKLSLLMAY